MAAAPTKANGASAQTATQLTESEMVERVLSMPIHPKAKAIDDALSDPGRIARIETLLPSNMRGQAERLAKRAVMTLNRKADQYATVSAASFVRCVLEAAELGLAIDGRLAHAVVFNNKVKENGREVWRNEAQLMVDYKGLIAVARRTNSIHDCYARLVYENDGFRMWEEDGRQHYTREETLSNRGRLLGAYAVVLLTPNDFRIEYMNNEEIDAIRARSKSWKGGAGFGPWKTDDGEMRKKTVIRRALKTYIDDPAFTRALEIDDQDYEDTALPPLVQRALEMPVGRAKVGAPPPQSDNITEDLPKDDGQSSDVDRDALADDLMGLVSQAKNAKELKEAVAKVEANRLMLGDYLASQVDAVISECEAKLK